MENSNAIIMGLSEKCLLDQYETEFERPTWYVVLLLYFLIKRNLYFSTDKRKWLHYLSSTEPSADTNAFNGNQ